MLLHLYLFVSPGKQHDGYALSSYSSLGEVVARNLGSRGLCIGSLRMIGCGCILVAFLKSLGRYQELGAYGL